MTGKVDVSGKAGAMAADGLSSSVHKNKVNKLASKLNDYWRRIRNEPQFNPVKQMAFELSKELESGQIQLSDLEKMIKILSDRALLNRAQEMRTYVGGSAVLDDKTCVKAFRKFVLETIEGTAEASQKLSFADFKKQFETPHFGIVFTAHPTFAMNIDMRAVLVELIESPDLANSNEFIERLEDLSHQPDDNITLAYEQKEAQSALLNADRARKLLHEVLFKEAKYHYPNDWMEFSPNILTLNSWVGYDLDGRTDIRWYDSLGFRLIEKRDQMLRHKAEIEEAVLQLKGSNKAIVSALDNGVSLIDLELTGLERSVELFSSNLSEPTELSIAANYLTSVDTPLRSKIDPLLEALKGAVSQGETDDEKTILKQLYTQINTGGMTTSNIHIRINAMQMHNAIRKPLGDGLNDLNSLANLSKLDKMILEGSAETVNFACLALERSTAVRQFIVMAQILKYIDGNAPIRLLIAECEHAFTVLSALYFAKLFDISGEVDISPLFETERAMERGAEIIKSLLKFQSYRDYVQGRGRLSIQTGFSDAGRFFGQIPAALAIEKLQRRISRIVLDAGLTDVEVLIFNTHGESMGRGAHPTSLRSRFDYLLSPAVRHSYWKKDLPLYHEVSFQGGDGYVFFGSEKLACATISNFVTSGVNDAKDQSDLLYHRRDFKEDLFEHLKHYQSKLFENSDYQTSLGALETNLLFTTGSRKSKRQFDGGQDNRVAAAKMRAIPHNALLQQFGFLANVISGFGSALRDDQEQFAQIYKGSARLQSVATMVERARQLSSVKTLVAYATIFNDAFWVTRPIEDMEVPLKAPCLYLANLLRNDDRHDRLMHFATYLREDDIHLHDLFTAMGKEAWQGQAQGHEKASVIESDMLHAIRISLIMHSYLLAGQLPVLAARNDVTHDDIMNMVLSLRIDDALVVLRDAYPRALPGRLDYTVEEPASYMDDEGADFEELNDTLIDPLVRSYNLIRQVGVGLGHYYRAHG